MSVEAAALYRSESWNSTSPLKDYFAVLGRRAGAEPEVIKAAYTALARKHHPDLPAAPCSA
jgi:curved DNA-binding protein CbpA